MSSTELTIATIPAHSSNYTVDRFYKDPTTGTTERLPIRCITIHHTAGVLSANACGAIFARAGRGGSSHYGIGNDGEIARYVDECNTAWTNSNWKSNCESVTIEVSNSKTGGDWPVGEAAFATLVKLVADIARRNNLGKLVKGDNLTWHSMVADKNRPTSCPGAYLLGKMDELVTEANRINGFVTAPDTPSAQEKSLDELADEVIAGKWGNNPDRKTRLEQAGYDYAAVQTLVNTKLGAKPAETQPAAQPTNGAIKVGDKVTLLTWVDENGTKLQQTRNFYLVAEISGERAVLRADSMNGDVFAAVKLSNLKKV